jgi:ComF family protein
MNIKAPFSLQTLLKERSSELLNLIFPKICMLCGHDLLKHETSICRFCIEHLPYTHFHVKPNNKIEQLFWGRIEIERATALLTYTKGGNVQKILKAIKYEGQTELAVKMGEIMGKHFSKSNWLSDIDLIIPVPLHPKKLKERGYNQSELLCKGIANATGLAINTNMLKRIVHTSTQTKKNRYDRFLNIDGVFSLGETEHQVFNHILLVDDVITTGSTLEGCARMLKQIHGARVSIASLAYADD